MDYKYQYSNENLIKDKHYRHPAIESFLDTYPDGLTTPNPFANYPVSWNQAMFRHDSRINIKALPPWMI